MKRSIRCTLLGTLALNLLLWSGTPLAAEPLATDEPLSAPTAKVFPPELLNRAALQSIGRSLTLKPTPVPEQSKQVQQGRAKILDVDGTLTSASETLQDGTYFEAHPFSGRAGQQIEINLESAEFDPYLLLIDPEGEVLAEHNNISANNLNARIQVTLPGNGLYIIVVNTARPQQQGGYGLEMTTALGSGAFQATLSWRSTDDLDVAVRDPNDEWVSFSEPRINSGGQLDVDSNAQCRGVTSTPVENIFWPANGAPQGEYVVAVSLYQHCGGRSGPVPFTLRLNVQGTVQTFEGTVDATEEEKFVFFDTAVY
ncbi:MAG: hypothetical protein AAGG51_12200 [Cyanobacteria bacterium P01_G01_bin.54]